MSAQRPRFICKTPKVYRASYSSGVRCFGRCNRLVAGFGRHRRTPTSIHPPLVRRNESDSVDAMTCKPERNAASVRGGCPKVSIFRRELALHDLLRISKYFSDLHLRSTERIPNHENIRQRHIPVFSPAGAPKSSWNGHRNHTGRGDAFLRTGICVRRL